MPWLVKSASGKKLLSKNGALLVGELDCKCCGCHDKNPCPAGQVCVDDECVDGCDDDHPCPPGQICLDGQCVDGPGGNCQNCDGFDCYPVINGRDTATPGEIVENGQVVESWGQGGRDWFQFKDDLEYYVDVFWECRADGSTRAIITSSVSSPGAQRATTWAWEDGSVEQDENGCPKKVALRNKTESCAPAGCLECSVVDPIPCPDDPDWDQNAKPNEPTIEFICRDRP